jgi:hypothetical protein
LQQSERAEIERIIDTAISNKLSDYEY